MASAEPGAVTVAAATDRSRCFWACMATCASGGAIYASPLFTDKLINEAGFSSANVVIFGVLMQLGYGAVTYPFSRLYNSMPLAPGTMDRLATAITSGLTFGSTGLLAIVLRQPEPSVAVCAVLFTSFGMGLGWSFFHAMCLANFLFADDNAKRRRAVASMSFAMGGGSMMFPLMFYFVTSSLSLADNFALMSGLFVIIAIYRWKFMFRARFAPLSEDEPSIVSSTAIPTATEPTITVAHATPLRAHDYLCNSIVWFTLVSSFFAHGVGTTYNSAIGNLATDLETPDVDRATFTMSMAFAASSLVARIVNTILYTFWHWPFGMVVWQGFLVSGIAIYCATQSTVSAYIASICVGLSQGGMSACLHVVASTCFPGTTVDAGFNLALAFSLISLSPILVGYVQTVVYEAASIAAFSNGTLATFFLFLGGAVISSSCALLLGVKLRRRHEGELALLKGSAGGSLEGQSVPMPSAAQTVPVTGSVLVEEGQAVEVELVDIESERQPGVSSHNEITLA